MGRGGGGDGGDRGNDTIIITYVAVIEFAFKFCTHITMYS